MTIRAGFPRYPRTYFGSGRPIRSETLNIVLVTFSIFRDVDLVRLGIIFGPWISSPLRQSH